MKHQQRSSDARGLLDLMDTVMGMDTCTDEVMVNMALELCMAQGETCTLARLVPACERNNMKAGVHTYSFLIKAYSTLRPAAAERAAACRLTRKLVEEKAAPARAV